MSGGKSNTTNVTNTGLGDQQFNTLNAGIASAGNLFGSKLNEGTLTTGKELQRLTTQVGSNQTDTTNKLNSLGTAQDAGFANVGNQIGETGKALGSQIGTVGQQVGAVGQQVAGVGDQVGAARTDIATGFANTGSQLTGLSNDVGQVGTAVGNLGTGMVAGFDYTNDNLDARTNAIYANQNEGFTNLSDLVGDGFTANSAQMTDYQKNIMLGQGKLNDALTAASQKQDNYYTGLAAGQDDIRGAVGGVQTGLNDFTTQYTKDAAQDLTDRRSLMTGVTNSTAMIRNDIGRTADATQRSLMQSVGGTAPPAATPATPQAGLSPTPVGGFVEQGPNQTVQMVNSLNNARSILTTMGDRLDPAIRSQYTELVSSFDARGALIPQGVDQSGAFVSRMMDGDSNLVVNKFNGSGQPLGRTGFNVNQMLAAADSFGANAQPATTGFMG